MISSSFETILPQKLKYQWFWSILSFLVLTASHVILNYYNEKLYLTTRICIVFSVGLWPIAYTVLSKKYYGLYKDSIKVLFKWSNDESNKWYIDTANNAFVLKKRNLAITLVFWVISIITIFSMPLPFKNTIVNSIGILGFLVTLFVGVHSIPLIYFCVKALYDLTKRNVEESYYSTGYELIQSIKNFYMGFAVFITGINLLLFLGFYYSPYGFHDYLVFWISFISIWPVLMYIATLYFIKKIEYKSKKIYIDTINQYVIKPSLEQLVVNHQNIDFENVKRNLEFREYLVKIKSSTRIDFTSMLTLVTTILGGAFQIITTIFAQINS